MSKGIRAYVNALFIELSAKRVAGEYGPFETTLATGNTAFRKDVKSRAELEFGITDASSSTAYNTAFKNCKEKHPELVVGLGRADDKKGGRKPAAKLSELAASLIAGAVGEGGEAAAGAENAAADAATDAAADAQPGAESPAAETPAETPAEEKVDAEPKAEEEAPQVAAEQPAEEEAPAVALVNVIRVKDSVVVAEQLTMEAAQEMIDKNAKQKKAKLAIQEAA